jgi:hypothetical protein
MGYGSASGCMSHNTQVLPFIEGTERLAQSHPDNDIKLDQSLTSEQLLPISTSLSR